MLTPSVWIYSLPFTCLNGICVVQTVNNSFNTSGGMFGELCLGELYTYSKIKSIVSITGTLVNKLSTSSENMLPSPFKSLS